jgi:hypothetical protein
MWLAQSTTTAAISFGGRLPGKRNAGPCACTAAITLPSDPYTGAATEFMPSANSS